MVLSLLPKIKVSICIFDTPYFGVPGLENTGIYRDFGEHGTCVGTCAVIERKVEYFQGVTPNSSGTQCAQDYVRSETIIKGGVNRIQELYCQLPLGMLVPEHGRYRVNANF